MVYAGVRMLREARLLAIVLALAWARRAQALPQDDGVSVRVRTGVGFPAGGIDDDHKLSDDYGVMVPFDFEAGYWFLPRLFVGAHGAFGILTVAGNACAAPLSCSASDVRFGAGAEYRLDVTGPIRKWASFGVGWELTSFQISRGDSSASRTDSGPEWAYVQIGADFSVGPGLAVGPWLGATIGEYRTATLHQGDGSEATYRIQSSTLHDWWLIGVRGVWTP
jgi:hypothetical protein